jgi:hypothetical protein
MKPSLIVHPFQVLDSLRAALLQDRAALIVAIMTRMNRRAKRPPLCSCRSAASGHATERRSGS